MSYDIDNRGRAFFDEQPGIIPEECDNCHSELSNRYDYHACDCGKVVCLDCSHNCLTCAHTGCEGCMEYYSDIDEWFCNNECKEEFYE